MEKRKVTKQIPHACPVCKGCGEVDVEIAQHEAQPKYENTNVYACHVCGGSCLIWEIREEEEDVIPPLLGQLQLPPTILTPQLPNMNPYTQPIIDPNYQPIVIDDPNNYRVTWATNRPPELGKLPDLQSYNSPAWSFGGLNDGKCACGPAGQPHHDNCKAG